MKERFKLSLSGIWLLTSLFSMILPVLMPSSADSHNFAQNVIGTATVTMFILSFPFSLFGLPAMYIASYVLGVEPNSIEGLYLNLFLLFVFGLVQWFWIVPRLGRTDSQLQMLNLPSKISEIWLFEAKAVKDTQFWDSHGQTPLERVFRERDSE
jgi:hypothetical protein